MHIRKIIAAMLMLCMILSSMPAVSGQEITTEKKADALNKLGLIEGDTKGNYNLSSNLKRPDSTVFIIKLLGKMGEIETNKNILKNTSFSDVKPTSWYAPFVGYCEQNSIMSGVGNNKFGVDANLSEQAFLQMVMKVLGYSGSEDCIWNQTVFKKAYEIGLVNDPAYLTKTKDNANYTRGKVVDIMYTALNLKLKGSDTTLIQQLINSGSIKREAAVSAGILLDSVLTKIQEVQTVNPKKMKILLSEVINSIDENNIKIYETANPSNALSISINSHLGNELILDTSTQAEDMSYTIEMTNVADMEGNIIAKVVSGFNGYKPVAIQSDLFKISLVEQISRTELIIYFTQPVNENVEYPPNYEIDANGQTFAVNDDLKVSVTGEKNSVALSLNSKVFTPGTEYLLKLSGELIGSYGVPLGDGNGDQYIFIAKDKQDSSLVLDKISAINSKCIKLEFNRQLNPVLAQQVYNYNVMDSQNAPIQIEKATVINDAGSEGTSVVLRLKTILDKNKTYSMMINRINDITKQYGIEEQSYSFSGTYSNQDSMVITDVSVQDAFALTVTFDRPVDTKSGLDLSNYTLNDMTYGTKIKPAAVKFASADQRTVKLYLKDTDKLIVNRPYVVKIPSTFQDYSGETLSSTLEQSFLVRSADNIMPSIKEAKIIGNDTIKATFDKEISNLFPNSSPQNYVIDFIQNDSSYKKIPIAITYIDDYNVIMRFDKLDKSVQYYLKCKSISDYAGNVNTVDSEKRVLVTLGV